jgi:hypothetical protein
MRVPEEPVYIDLFRQNSVFTSLHLKSPVHVHRLWVGDMGTYPRIRFLKSLRLIFVILHELSAKVIYRMFSVRLKTSQKSRFFVMIESSAKIIFCELSLR